MGEITDRFASVFRDYETEGVPASGGHEPVKKEIRALGSWLDHSISAAQAGLTTVPDITARDAFYANAENQDKLVYVNNNNGSDSDPANGVYEYVEGSARLAASFYEGVAAVVQPLVDEVNEGVAIVTGIATKPNSSEPMFAVTDEDGNAAMMVSATEIRHRAIQQLEADALTAGGSVLRQSGANRLVVTDEEGNACAVFDAENTGGGSGGAPSSDYVIEPASWSYGDSDAASREYDPAQTAYIFVSFGQSNAIGTDNDVDAVISGTATYPDNALMPGSVRVTSGGNSLVPLVESGTGSVKETAVSAMVNHFIREHDSTFGVKPTVVGFAAGVGGQPMMALKRGSTGYGYLLAGIGDAVRGLRERSFRKFVTVINWVGSEGDADKFYGMAEGWWRKMALQFFRQVQQDVMELTGETLPPLVVLQPIAYNPANLHGSVPLPSGGSGALDLWDAPVLRGMLALDGVGNIRTAPPAYAYPHSTAVGDGLHRNCTGHYWTGLNLAKVAWAELIGTGWRGCRPSLAEKPYFATATQIVVPFETQGGGPDTAGGDDGTALVLDSSGDYVTTLTNHGLEFDDGSGSPPAITAVSVDGNRLVVDLAGAPTGPRPRIAGGVTPTTPGGVGPVDGPRMTIRDKHGWVPIHAGAGTDPIYNFAHPFVLEI